MYSLFGNVGDICKSPNDGLDILPDGKIVHCGIGSYDEYIIDLNENIEINYDLVKKFDEKRLQGCYLITPENDKLKQFLLKLKEKYNGSYIG